MWPVCGGQPPECPGDGGVPRTSGGSGEGHLSGGQALPSASGAPLQGLLTFVALGGRGLQNTVFTESYRSAICTHGDDDLLIYSLQFSPCGFEATFSSLFLKLFC